MKFTAIAAAALVTLAPLSALAETHEVKMLNKGETGAMVFEPRFVKAEVGDVIKFLPTDKGHNAQSLDDMLPDGQEPFKGKINQELDVEMTADGIVTVKCLPHFAMGMVMIVQVGDDNTVPEGFLDAKLPGKSKKVLEEIIDENLSTE